MNQHHKLSLLAATALLAGCSRALAGGYGGLGGAGPYGIAGGAGGAGGGATSAAGASGGPGGNGVGTGNIGGAAGSGGASGTASLPVGGAGGNGAPGTFVGGTINGFYNLGGSGGGGGGGGVGFVGSSLAGVSGPIQGGNGGHGGIQGVGGSGGGGGGGGDGVVITGNGAITVLTTVTGGNGGAAYFSGYGETSGGGGAGLVALEGATITNQSVITGGVGGAGSYLGSANSGGSGAGIVASGATIINRGTIQGGAGGYNYGGLSTAPGAGSGGAPPGGAGVGIIGGNLTVVTSGLIAGGSSGAANAISFTAGTNSLELQQGWSILGRVVGESGSTNTLILGGAGTDLSGATGSTIFNVSQIAPAGSISQQYQGFTVFEKTGTSTWRLTGSTTALTPWQILGGTLQISSNTNLGNAAGGLTINGGTLNTTATFTSARTVTLGSNNGTIDVNPGTTLTLSGVIGGPGSLTKTDTGTLVLSGTNTYIGGTTIDGGTLQVSSNANLGNAAGNLTIDGGTLNTTATFASARTVTLGPNNGTIDVNPGTTLTMAGVIGGPGSLTKIDTGTLTLTGTNTYTGGTTISAGTLQLGDGVATGSIVGDVLNNAALVFDPGTAAAAILPGVISGPGTVAQTGPGTTILTGTNTYTGGTTITAGTLQLGDGVTTGSITGDVLNNSAFAFAPGTATPLALSGVISGTGTVDQIGPGTTILSGANTYSGDTTVAGGILQAGALNTFSPNSAMTVATAGTVDLAGFSQTVGGVTNAGLINMGTGTPPGTLLTTPNYVGQGGTIAMNTFLGADGSASDQLVINGGTASGTSGLLFTNAGGPGAQTTANGILVVNTINGATTATDSFTMANPELRAGIYDYRLFQGGINGSDPNNWFLRSTFVVEPPPTQPPPELEVPPGVLPPLPPPEVLPPGIYPIIGPEIATYGVVQPIARQLGIASLGTHDERMGEIDQAAPAPCAPGGAPIYTKASKAAPPIYYTKAPSADCGAAGWRPAVWGRVFGQQIDNHYQAFADPRADGRIAGLQAGVDLLRGNSLIDGHKDYGGVYFAYGNANVDVTGLVTNAAATAYVLQHTGHLNLNAYSGGAYWTHYGPQGWYIDLTLQGTSYNGAATTEFARLNTNGSGFISSLEGGYPIALPQLGWGFVLEPQAQVLWQWVSFDAGNDGLGPVALGTSSGTTARVGLKGKWTITSDNGQVWQPYVRTNYWSDFGGNPTTMFGIDTVPLISHAQYMDVTAGFTTKIDAHFSAFADAGYQFAVSHDGGGRRDGVKGSAGLRYQW